LKQPLSHLFRFSLPLVILFLCILIGILNPAFLSLDNLLNVLLQASIVTLVAVGMTVVIILGGIDLAVGSLVAVCGILLAVLLRSGFSVPISICGALLSGSVLGALSGVLVGYKRVPAFISTLGMMSAARGLALLLSDGRSISGFDDRFTGFAAASVFGLPMPVLVLLGVSLITFLFLRSTRWGVRLYAIGGNQRAAWLSGIAVQRYYVAAYGFSGLLSGLAGVILTSRLSSALPTAGSGYELEAIAAVVIGGAPLSGGRGSVIGSLFGSLILAVLKNGLTILNVSSYLQQILIGIIVVAAVLVDSKLHKGD
jgi:ribose/xylose/arabinose/galactoside ABC-type transport system permease subunit